MAAMDPHALLGVRTDATPEEIAAAYRKLAKEWHPDLGGADAGRTMALINAAYDLLRSEGWQQRAQQPARNGRAPRGAWLPDAVRRALGAELLGALRDGERVAVVTPAATWASPHTLLAVTDRRLVWLLDDAPLNRIRSLDFAAVRRIEPRRSWPRRRSAALRVIPIVGRPFSFTELRPPTAQTIAAHVVAALRTAAGARRA
jgi:curved DNA-binding protein CbpA